MTMHNKHPHQQLDNMAVNYISADIESKNSGSAVVVNSLYSIKDPSIMLKELMETNSEYENGLIRITHGSVSIQTSWQEIVAHNVTQDIISYWLYMQNYFINYGWTQQGWNCDLEMYMDNASGDGNVTVGQTYVFMASDAPPVDNIGIINTYGTINMLNEITFLGENLPQNVYSNGGEYILNEHTGVYMPQGISYIPLYNWNGEDKTFGPDDLEVNG